MLRNSNGAIEISCPKKGKIKMKKLMIMLAASILAIGAQAASWQWTSTSAATTPGGSTVLAGADIYLFFGYASSQLANDAKGDLLTNLRAGNSVSGYSQRTTLGSDGKLAVQEFEGPEGRLYAFAVIIADDAAGNTYMLQTANKNATGLDTGAATLSFDISSTKLNALDATGTSAGWYQTAEAPEPTSGLLMLLGLAGLALKRKRA